MIADLVHVSPLSLRVAIAARGWQRTILVTDAMPTVGSDIAGFTMGGQTVRRENGRLVNEDGTLAGADLDMASAVRNTVAELGVAGGGGAAYGITGAGRVSRPRR